MGVDLNKLDLRQDVAQLSEDLVNIESVSGDEALIADVIEHALGDHVSVQRLGNTVVARTDHGHAERVVIAGHIDTVPVNGNLPARRDEHNLHGLGSCDMKGGVAIALRTAATMPAPNRDITYLFYECEEVEAERNGLTLLSQADPGLLEADFAILMEPSGGVVEAGCQGTLGVDVLTRGERAHSARSWKGVNAIHESAAVLALLNDYVPRRPVIDGLEFREGLNAVAISGGVAGNVLPDLCRVSVNYRFAPDRSEEQAQAHLREVFDGFEIEVSDSAPGALPGLAVPAAAAFIAAVGGTVNPKFGWTDVARFSALGVPAVNFGPGDPQLAHKREEFVPLEQLSTVEQQLRAWLGEQP
ncbi:succinyl-diaminopimelate desuccinylase [soil metagenome]